MPVHTEEDQEQPLAERQVVLAVLLAQVVGVPAQAPTSEDQEQPLAERQVLLVVPASQAAGVPPHDPALVHEQPLPERQVALVVLLAHVVGVPVQSRLVASHVQPVCVPQAVELEW